MSKKILERRDSTTDRRTLRTFIANDQRIGIADRRKMRDGKREATLWRSKIAERTIAENALRESEKRYQRITEAITDYIYTVRVTDGCAAETTHGLGCLAVTGYREDEFAEDPFLWVRMVEAEDRPGVEKQARRILAGEDVPPIEHRIVHKNGTLRWVKNIFVPHRDELGVLISYDGLIQDITERKMAEAALHESEEKFRLLSLLSPAGIYMATPSGECLYANDFWCKMAGLAPEEALGMGWIRGIHPDDRQMVLDNWEKMIASRGKWEKEYRFQNREGETTWVYGVAAAQEGSDGNIIRYIGVNIDITERKQAEEELRRQRTLLQNSERISKVGGWEYDIAAKRMIWTDELYRIYGVSPETYDPNPIQKNIAFYAPEDQTTIAAAFQRAIEQGEPYDLQLRFTNATGKQLWVRTIGQPEFIEGRFMRVYGNFMDITERKQAEEARRASQQIIEGIINTIPVRVFWKDRDLVFLGCNAAFARDAGFADPKDIIGKDDYQMGWRDQAELYRGDDRQVIESGCSKLLIEEPQTTPEGSIITLLTSKIPLRGSNGEISGVLGTYMDITERKRTQEALRESEQRLVFHMENSPLAVIEWDMNFNVTRWSGDSERIFGWSAAETIGKPIMDLNIIFEEDIPIVHKTMEHLTGGAAKHVVSSNRNYTKDRQVIYCEWYNSVLLDQQGKMVSVMSQVLDVTERKRAEEALRESEEKFARAFRDAPVWIAITDIADATYLDVNEHMLRVTGFSREEVIGHTAVEIGWMKRGDRARLLNESQDHGRVTDVELTFHAKDGRTLQGLVTGGQIIIGGRPCLLTVTIDITERKRAEAEKEKLEAQNRQLQKAESLGRMAGAIAHHFNNQLGAVMGNLELAMVALSRGAGPVEKLKEAMQAARRAAKVSGLMLTYLGQTRGKREPLDLFETCRRSLPLLQAAVPFEVVLETDLPSPGPTISADANQIQQVLTNLCANAWEAAGDGRGGVHLIVKVVPAADIPAALRFPLDWQPQETTYACLEVADTGCGIAGPDIEKLFDPFYSTKFAGRGMGLSAVITVQSEPGHGSIFRVFFPVSAEAVPRPPEKAVDTPEAKGGGTVLLVEDMDMMRNTTKSMLEFLGFSVLEARDGVEALEVFRQRQDEIRFVLCDLTMPRMDGWETLAALRELAPGIPVILSSGHNEARVMAGDHPRLPEAFLSKPYGFKELREAIASALADKK
jgi:PAS domain S-box-containing protein